MKITKKWFWMAAALALASLIAGFTAKPLIAQIKAALVQSIDEPGRNPYMSVVRLKVPGFGGNCPDATDCLATFTTVPAGKRLVATNVTGVVLLDTPGILFPPALVANDNSGNATFLTRLPTTLLAGVIFGSNQIAFDDSIRLYFEPGTTPAIDMSSTTPFSQADSIVTLSGYYVSLP